jgi:hypothetical protein
MLTLLDPRLREDDEGKIRGDEIKRVRWSSGESLLTFPDFYQFPVE